ncbi:hypothetical protein QEZ54_31610 [Catellatospora sp. KI3]|uniref:hypothetical protein n=1 Tax=Catellatospora sp. KI3 TaxID=3041620 RepID=UPI002482C9DF|nr:hypothetical protein [Catellatospora sp. KI3]MDI1465526.1 hypothetical protein [Catellatospora sp. KI3]
MLDNPYRAPDSPAAVAVQPGPAPAMSPDQYRARRMWRGAGIAALGHAATVGAATLAALAFARPGDGYYYDSDLESAYIATGLLSQLVLGMTVLVYGITRIVKRDSLGVGLLVGWAVGLLVTPIPALMVLTSLNS